MGTADHRLRVGLRLGFALPLGYIDNRDKLSTPLSGELPIWIDAGYMLTPHVMVGLYGQYGFVRRRGYCLRSCSAHDVRFGGQAQYHLIPEGSADPWIGLGVGYEVLSFSGVAAEFAPGGGSTLRPWSSNWAGFEFINMQAGGDFKVAKPLTVGPFTSFSLGKYSSESVDGAEVGFPEPGSTTSLHEWVTFGAKGTFAL